MEDNQIMEKLNVLLEEELAAIDLYILHAELCDNCGYTILRDVLKKHAMEEIDHTQKLMSRILELEGIPAPASFHPFFKRFRMEEAFEGIVATEEGP